MNEINLFKTHWLNLDPIIVDEQRNIISTADLTNRHNKHAEISIDGIEIFLNLGYSGFGSTILEGVHVIPPRSRIETKGGKIASVLQETFSEEIFQNVSNPEQVILKIKKRVNNWIEGTKGLIIVPLSGGYDSRLLLSLIDNKDRVIAATYGISGNQLESVEVVRAREIARRLNVPWTNIQLGNFHRYMPQWNEMFGITTHAHGMYQMEFYDKLAKKYPGSQINILSGIVGDIWAGNLSISEIKNPQELYKLSYSHGMNAKRIVKKEKGLSNQARQNQILSSYYDFHKPLMHIEKYRIILSMQNKMMLLRYLIEVPEKYGMHAWSPFLDEDIAIDMLNIPGELRHEREWQKKYFEENGLANKTLPRGNSENVLNINAILDHNLVPLPKKSLGNFVSQKNINHEVNILFNRKTIDVAGKLIIIERTRIAQLCLRILFKVFKIDFSITKFILRRYFCYLVFFPLLVKRES